MAIGASSIFLLVILAVNAVVVDSTSTAELDATIAALRSHGYNLFANALTTSDILFELHANFTTRDANASVARSSFTLFAPPDSTLFALDMTASALVYVQTLRCHIVPRRIAASELLLLQPGSCLPTLLPRREIRVQRRLLRRSIVIAVDGVNVVVPGMYYGEGVAVHGLAGALNFRSHVGARRGWDVVPDPYSVSEMNGTGSANSTATFPANQTFIPQIPKQPVANGSMFSPIPRLPIFNHSIPPPAVNSPLPSSAISSPPETLTGNEMTGPPQISPSKVKLHDSLTEESTTRIRKHSAKLLEVADQSTIDLDDELAEDGLLAAIHKAKALVAEPDRPSPGHDATETAGGQLSDEASHDTGYEL
uniref:FAS1 domain-containing protein n=1 Tax=Kalanchoe fedtschenkoi TaxID=63787 RepID=A0A7N0RHS6_KALFE